MRLQSSALRNYLLRYRSGITSPGETRFCRRMLTETETKRRPYFANLPCSKTETSIAHTGSGWNAARRLLRLARSLASLVPGAGWVVPTKYPPIFCGFARRSQKASSQVLLHHALRCSQTHPSHSSDAAHDAAPSSSRFELSSTNIPEDKRPPTYY